MVLLIDAALVGAAVMRVCWRGLRGPLRAWRVLRAFCVFRMQAVGLRLMVSLRRLRAQLDLPLTWASAMALGVIAAQAKSGELLKERRAALDFKMLARGLAAMDADLILRRQRQILNPRHSLLPDNRRIGNKGA